MILILGVPGTGKSTYALQRAVELGRAPAYLLAHDPGYRLPTRLPDGRTVILHRHATLEQGKRALERDPRGVHAFAVADGEQVLRLGAEVAEASLAKHAGQKGHPVVVVLDEGVGTAGASAYRLGDTLRESLALRRHRHVGVLMTAQDPRLVHYALGGLATEIVLFRVHDRQALDKLARLGVSPAELDRVPQLPNFRHIVCKLG